MNQHSNIYYRAHGYEIKNKNGTCTKDMFQSKQERKQIVRHMRKDAIIRHGVARCRICLTTISQIHHTKPFLLICLLLKTKKFAAWLRNIDINLLCFSCFVNS